MIFRQLFDEETHTYTYLLADELTRNAALIDSVEGQWERDSQLIEELNLQLSYLLETHVHADHVTGVTRLKQRFPEAQSVVSKYSDVECADVLVDQGDILEVGSIQIKVLATPGHTNGCMSYYTQGHIFTGDALLIRGTGRTDFQQGDAGRLYDSVTEKLFALPDDTFVYPAHDYRGQTRSTIGEEKRFNPRLAGQNREAFIALMNELRLPYPSKIMEAVPANQQCGNRD